MTSRAGALAAGVVGLLLVAAIASAVGLPREDLLQVVGIAGGAALLTGMLGAAALRLLRGRSFTAQVVVVALTSTSAVTAGALAGGSAMFFDAHDLQVLAVVVAVGAVISVVAAMLLGVRVGAASRSLSEVARRLGDLDGVTPMPEGAVDDDAMPEHLIAEFARLADQLVATRVELAESRARERATDRARRELVSWVSHDLRTPLAGIRAVTELLEDGLVTDADEVARYYATLRRESEKLAALVDDLFVVARIEAGALSIEPVDIDLTDLVTDTVSGARPVAARRGITVQGRVEGASPTIRGGLPELTRVLRNLVSNAVRESADGGSVVVEAGVAEGSGWVAVTDSCGGIPDDVIDRVFEASYRGESARTPRSEGGGGLGLAIARGFAEAHGGRIAVANVAGGCRFTVTVPAAGPVTPAAAPPPGSAGLPGPGPA